MPSLADFRARYPQYDDLSDDALANALRKKFYSDIPEAEFNAKVMGAPRTRIQLPDGRQVDIATDDPKAAAAAGRKIFEREGGRPAVPVAEKVWDRSESVTSGDAFKRAAANQYGNNLLAIPAMIGDSVMVNPFRTAKNLVQGELAEPVLGTGPIPRLTMGDMRAAGDVAGQIPDMVTSGELNPGERFTKAQRRQADIDRLYAEQAPIATGLGGVAGDVGTVLTGRLPFSRALVSRTAPKAAEAVEAGAPGVKNLIDRTWKSSGLQKLRRALNKSGEAGVEASVLSTLNGGDPVETAALSMGGQLAGSLALTVIPRNLSQAGTFGGVVLGSMALVRLMQDILPGGEKGDWGAASDVVMDKMKLALISGTLAGIAGAGRLDKGILAENLPRIADAITAIPRAGVISLWSEATKSPEILPVLEDMAANPREFTKAQRDTIQRAITSKDKSVGAAIDRLAKESPEFKRRLDGLRVGN